MIMAALGCLILLPAECRSTDSEPSVNIPAAESPGTISFVESWPEETSLDLPAFPQAWQVWPAVLDEAAESVSVASFYFSRQGDGKDAPVADGLPDHLVPILDDLARAGQRGCRVRVLGDAKFFSTYPEVLTELDGQEGIQTRHLDARALWSGVLHAKYFVVDDRILYIGSQNWDWRALSQIRELGALVEHPRLAGQLREIFDLDWKLAAASPPAEPTGSASAAVRADGPCRWEDSRPTLLTTARGDTIQAVLAASPPQALPAGIPWDLDLITEMIDSATGTIRLQLLSYGVTDREHRFFPTLDNALRRAATRRVKVQIILSNWAKVHYSLPWIQSLAAVPGIEIKFSNIPEHSRGLIPYSRVEHAKYMTVDGQACWLGTSNWSRDYFHASRNISLLLHGVDAARQLDEFFALGWNGPYTETVDPCGDYSPPRRK